jgi:hypothetical protein
MIPKEEVEKRREKVMELFDQYFTRNGRKELVLTFFNNGEGFISVSYFDIIIPLLQKVEIEIVDNRKGESHIFPIYYVEPEVMKLFYFLESEDFDKHFENVKFNLEHGFFVFPVYVSKGKYVRTFVFHHDEIKVIYFDLEKKDVKKEVILFQRDPLYIDLEGFKRESRRL